MGIRMFNFLNAADYDYDSAEIQVVDGQVILLPDGTGGFFSGSSKITPSSALNISQLVGITGVWIKDSPADITFVIEIDGQDKWFTDGAWLDSADGSESNILADILEGLTYLQNVIDETKDVRIAVYLTGDGTYTPVLHDLVITFFQSSKPSPAVFQTLVWGRVAGVDGLPLEGVRVATQLKRMVLYDGDILVANQVNQAITNKQGYWELLLADNESMQYPPDTGIGKPFYIFSFGGKGINLREERYVIKATEIEYNNLERLGTGW